MLHFSDPHPHDALKLDTIAYLIECRQILYGGGCLSAQLLIGNHATAETLRIRTYDEGKIRPTVQKYVDFLDADYMISMSEMVLDADAPCFQPIDCLESAREKYQTVLDHYLEVVLWTSKHTWRCVTPILTNPTRIGSRYPDDVHLEHTIMEDARSFRLHPWHHTGKPTG